MAKATTKDDLIKMADNNFNKLFDMIKSLSSQQQKQNFIYNKDELTAKDNAAHWKRDNNLRDVLIHLHEWHTLLINWISSNEKGRENPFLPKPYTWTNYQQLNLEFFNKHQETSYEKALEMVKKSHNEVMQIIKNFSEKQLFEKKHFSWTGTTSLAQYCHSATVAHYEWAIKKIKAYQKALKW